MDMVSRTRLDGPKLTREELEEFWEHEIWEIEEEIKRYREEYLKRQKEENKNESDKQLI